MAQLCFHGRIFMEFGIWVLFENFCGRFKLIKNLTRITPAYMKINIHFWSYLFRFLQWEIFLTNAIEILKTHFTFNIPSPENRAVVWDIVETCGSARRTIDANITRLLHFACWISLEPPDTHSEYVALLGFRRKQWLRGSTSVLTHWGRVTQICVFTLQLCKTDDANLRF